MSSSTKKPGKRKRADTKVLDDFHDSDYPTSDEPADDRGGGGKTHPLLFEISKIYRGKNPKNGKDVKRVRCLGSKGCKTTWVLPRAKARILKHAHKCGYIPVELRRRVSKMMAEEAVGEKANVKGNDESGASGSEVEIVAPPKRIKMGSAAGNSGSKSGPLGAFVRAGRKELQDKADHALIVFIACCGIPPNVADSREFKTFVSVLNTDYSPPSETTLRDKLIPNEAANIHEAILRYLPSPDC